MMDNDFNNMQMQEMQQQEELMRQESQRMNDPVLRGDWDKKKKQDSKKSIIILVAFIVFAALFIFAMAVKGQSSAPVQQEPSVLSLYEDITTEETRGQYMKMEQQVQEFQRKQEEQEHGWTLIYVLCAVGALTPAFVVLISFIRSGRPVPPFSEAAKATVICLGGAALLFALNIGCAHVYAEGNDTLKKLMILALASILILAVWIYTKGLSNKD